MHSRLREERWARLKPFQFRWITALVCLLFLPSACAPEGPDVAVSIDLVKGSPGVEVVNQYSGTVKPFVRARSAGKTDFTHSGELFFYRGSTLVASQKFSTLTSGKSALLNPTMKGESCFNNPSYTLYKAKVVFDPPNGKQPSEIDSVDSNNEASLNATEVCQLISDEYLAGYRPALLALINSHRAQNGAGPLTLSSCMTDAAQGHSEWMKETGTFSHTGENGSDHGNRCSDVGCSCTAENIYSGSMAPKGAFEAWRDSAGHNENMLNPSFTEIGIGMEGGLATTVFG